MALVQVVMGIGLAVSARAAAAADAPEISNVNIETPSVARYDKFEVAFNVKTVATHYDLPYDANPPPGVVPGIGVTVDALFSNDNWRTTITQPAFLYQPFIYSTFNNRDHFVPDGAPRWTVRFAPQATGAWQLRLRVQDANGTTTFPTTGALAFNVTNGGGGRYDGLRNAPYTRHGFLQVSPNDTRYFDFQDGTPFVGLGYNPSADTVEMAQERFSEFERNGIQFARLWLSGAGINGSQWTPWAFPQQPYNQSLPATILDPTQRFGDADLSFRLDAKYSCLFTDFWQNNIPVKPNTSYNVTVRAKLYNVKPKANASDAGFTVVRDGWLGQSCSQLKGDNIIKPRLGTTDWFTETGTLTTGKDQRWLNYLYLALRNIGEGWAYIDSVQLTEQGDPNSVDILRDPKADSHMYFDPMNAAKWDLIIQAAEEHGVFLKLVSDEKNEWIRNSIQADGSFGKFSNNNFYAQPNTKVRWLDQAWWRYLIARWGYSTAIHSFEFVNEGDPYNGNLYNAVEAMAQYFDENDPAKHMVTTSFWTSFPNPEFWSNPKYSDVAYADLHAYILTGWGPDASFVSPGDLETRPEYVYSGKTSFRVPATKKLQEPITPRGVLLNEPGEWTLRYRMKADGFSSNCSFGSQGGLQRLFWQLDGGANNGGSEGVVPGRMDGKTFLCSSPAGTFDWREFDSQRDRDGKLLPIESRIVISDTLPHPLTISVWNAGGVKGDAWIDDVQLVSPSGQIVPVLGEFDNTPFESDTAWLTAAYSLLWGGSSPVGAHKPLVRGETGVNSEKYPNGVPELNLDQQGVWLHNFVWGQINPGGMYDLWWWGKQNIEANSKTGRSGDLYWQYLTFASFMADVPLNNGRYRDAQAASSDPNLRAWGQRDDEAGRAHLWIQNRSHTWDAVVRNERIEPIQGTVVLKGMKPGTYRIEWWDPYKTRNQVFRTDTIEITDTLTLTLPTPLQTDVGVKLYRLSN